MLWIEIKDSFGVLIDEYVIREGRYALIANDDGDYSYSVTCGDLDDQWRPVISGREITLKETPA